MRQSHKTFLVWVMLIFAFLVVWQLFNTRQPETKLAFSTFIQKVEKSPEEFKPTSALQIRMNAGNHAEFKGQWKKDDQWFVTTGYIGDSIFEKLNKSGLQYEIVKENEGGFWQQVLITWLPMSPATRRRASARWSRCANIFNSDIPSGS